MAESVPPGSGSHGKPAERRGWEGWDAMRKAAAVSPSLVSVTSLQGSFWRSHPLRLCWLRQNEIGSRKTPQLHRHFTPEEAEGSKTPACWAFAGQTPASEASLTLGTLGVPPARAAPPFRRSSPAGRALLWLGNAGSLATRRPEKPAVTQLYIARERP